MEGGTMLVSEFSNTAQDDYGLCLIGKKKIPGLLKRVRNGFELTIFSEENIAISEDKCETNIYFKGKITECFLHKMKLVECHSEENFLSGIKINFKKYEFKGIYSFKNKHFDVINSHYRGVSLKIPGLENFVPSINPQNYHIGNNPPERMPICSIEDSTIYVDYISSLSSNITTFSSSLIPFLSIEFSEGNDINLEDCWRNIQVIENVLDLLTGQKICLGEVSFYLKDNEHQYMNFLNGIKPKEINHILLFNLETGQDLFKNLIAKYSIYEHIIKLYLHISLITDLLPRLRFVSLVNCLENLCLIMHPNESKSRFYNDEIFKNKIKEFGTLIKENKRLFSNDDHANTILSLFENSNLYNIWKNLGKLIDDDYLTKTLFEDKKQKSELVKKIVEFRNKYSHPSADIPGEEELAPYNDLLLFIFRYSLFINLGFQNKDALYHKLIKYYDYNPQDFFSIVM
jgi:hypothetical protein